MKRTLTLFILATCSLLTHGQRFSWTIDSLTAAHIRQLPAGKQLHFDHIMQHRTKLEWLTRVDTSGFDYAFIEETFCAFDTTFTVTERYFSKSDSIPANMYRNGIYADPKTVYDGSLIWYSKHVTYYTTLLPLIDHYSTLKPTQELPYNKGQIWLHGCLVDKKSKDNFEKRRTEQLKTTWQIQTMVDRVNHTIVVSVQFAPKRPKFETHGYNPVWDW